jgi:hypothetical protein
MTRTEQAIERLDTLVQQNGALVQQNSTLTGILEVCDMNAEERALGKKKIVEAIIKMGGNASEDDSLFALAAAIKKLKTLDPRTVVTDDLPRPVNVGTYICQPELLKNKIVHAYSEEVTSVGIGLQKSVSLESVTFPNAKSLGNYALESTNCSMYSFPQVETIGQAAIAGETNPKFLDIKNVQSAGSMFLLYKTIDNITLPKLSTHSGSGALLDGVIAEEIHLPSLTTIRGILCSGTDTKILDIPNFANSTLGGQTKHRLIDLIIGKNIKFAFSLGSYNPAEAYSKTSASLVDKGEPFSTNNQKWNYNLREHFAANLDDRTGLDAFTITFGSTVLAQMEEATIEAFTSKNWTLA